MSTQKQIDNSVNIFDPTISYKPVTLTTAAIAHVKKKLKERGAGIGLRLSVKKAGCSGLEYVVDYVDAKQVNEAIFSIEENLAVYVSLEDLPFLHGTEIDYVQKGITGGELKFNNPNAKVSCGCGESFNV
jgi:iron-sulfur cluster assembly protein